MSVHDRSLYPTPQTPGEPEAGWWARTAAEACRLLRAEYRETYAEPAAGPCTPMPPPGLLHGGTRI